jgi:hypothetical protein
MTPPRFSSNQQQQIVLLNKTANPSGGSASKVQVISYGQH